MKKIKLSRYITRKLHNYRDEKLEDIISIFNKSIICLISFIIGFTIISFFKLDTEYYFFPILNLILILYYLSSKYGREEKMSIKEYEKIFRNKITIVSLIGILSISIDFSSYIFVIFLLIFEIILLSAIKTMIEKNKIIGGSLLNLTMIIRGD